LSFEEENSTTCPRCGQIVPSGNAYCGKCGAPVPRIPFTHRDELGDVISTHEPAMQHYPGYKRKFSIFERILNVLFSPREAMEDIGHIPDYEGVLVIFVLWTIVTAIDVFLTLPKIQFSGSNGELLNSLIVSTAWASLILVPILLIIRWLIKSYLIQHGCDSNKWDFGTAASVTGYAYLPNVVFSLVGAILTWMFMPSIVINTTNLDQAYVQLLQFASQTMWISVGIPTGLSFIALFWKSKLGSYGAYSGTRGTCSEGSAFGIFLLIGFIGLLIDLIINFLG
jgi:hypothetical protein